MTDKDLKKLSRKQLLELLLTQTERADQLEQELAILRAKLEDRTVGMSESGSIAEAALRLNGVFEAAQAAADQYLENIKRLHDEQVAATLEATKAVVKEGERSDPPPSDKPSKSKKGDQKRCKKKKKSRSRMRN